MSFLKQMKDLITGCEPGDSEQFINSHNDVWIKKTSRIRATKKKKKRKVSGLDLFQSPSEHVS